MSGYSFILLYLSNNDLNSSKLRSILKSRRLLLDLLSILFALHEANINNRIIGELYADNLNETEISSYNLLNVTYSKQIFNNSEIYLGVNNLLDVNYFDNIRINAFGKRYYEPAPNRNVYFGMNFSF